MLNEKYEDSPYFPTFGTPPEAYINRYDDEKKILNKFNSKINIPYSYMIIGARGTGKTVLMHEMANRFEGFDDWVVARLNSNGDLLEDLFSMLVGKETKIKANIDLHVLKVDVSRESVRNTEAEITNILKELKRKDKRLLITVDEATNTPAMRTFVTAYQNFIGQKLPVYMLMTGVFEVINNLKNEKNLTFLYRMPRIIMEPLSIPAIAENYGDVFCLDGKSARKMALLTKGYSYAFQLLGDMTWEKDGDFESVQQEYREMLYEVSYEKIWEEASKTDRDVMYSIAVSRTGEVREIRDILGKKSNEYSPYADRLKKKGVAIGTKNGQIAFALPYFKGFVLEKYNGSLLEIEGMPEDL